MNSIKLCILALVSGISLQTSAYFPCDKIWHGSIKFPVNTKNIPPVQIYYAGTNIRSEIQPAGKQVTFDISESKVRNTFCLFIADQVDFVTEQNTVKHLTAPKNRPYKMFLLEFIPNKEVSDKPTDVHQTGSWHVAPTQLAADRYIPDNSIIVLCHANLVKKIEGGNGLELPKIVLDERVLCQLSDNDLRDALAKFSLAALDCNTIHARQSAHIKADAAKKTVISMIYS